jgi:hypothetical protein
VPLAELVRDAITQVREASHALTARYPLETIDSVLLLTDGASAGVDDYGHPATWREALTSIQGTGPGPFLTSIHALEETDPAGQKWPRAKPHDDKTLALIRVPWRRR